MSEQVIRFVPRGDITPEEEREMLARVYAYALRAQGDRRTTKTCDEAAPPTAPERRLSDESRRPQ
jgi:hypothetical protein